LIFNLTFILSLKKNNSKLKLKKMARKSKQKCSMTVVIVVGVACLIAGTLVPAQYTPLFLIKKFTA
jgi:nucleoside recognition membrane protein YjiH